MASEEDVRLEVPVEKAEAHYEPLPSGKYVVVGIDIDTTGKRLIDEIVQVALYTPAEEYSQYIMPLMNLNPAARQRHQVRVVTMGFFRMLKNMQTFKVLKSKTEVAALNDFLDHLEKIKTSTEGCDGIILIFHEQRKFVPYMIIEALKKYKLLTRFMETVKSFVNTCPIAIEMCGNPLKYFTLRQTSNILSEFTPEEKHEEKPEEGAAAASVEASPTEENAPTEGTEGTQAPQVPKKTNQNDWQFFEGNAAHRAKLCFEIGQQLACKSAETCESGDSSSEQKLHELAVKHAHSIDVEIEELKEQELNLERQSSMRPIFLNYFRTTLRHRVKAVTYRRILAELGFNLEALKDLWNEKKREGLVEAVSKSNELKEEDQEELVEILDHHFDPEKVPVKPKVTRRRPFNRQRGSNTKHEEQNNNAPSKGGKDQQGARGGSDQESAPRQKRSPRRSNNYRRTRYSQNGIQQAPAAAAAQ